MGAQEYNKQRIASGDITPRHIELLARSFQSSVGLTVDGQIGPKTVAALEAKYPQPQLTHAVMRPLGNAKPLITSGHWLVNPSRAPSPSYHGHQGVDVMYRLAELPGCGQLRTTTGALILLYDGLTLGRVYSDGRYCVPPNTYCYACFAGTVIDVVDRANGWVVTIETTSGMVAVYRHLQTVAVTKGQKLEGGDKVGIVGHTTETSLVHLHFELHRDRYALQHDYRGSLNPEPYMVWGAQ